ncbi:MAG TPA: methyltransferase domain-containing protein [Terriglobales bacterium]|jgi:SAM-dependent methyltransferase|nr:methyltransferase domain-containing protein [Terriglobales bacterium]
MGTSLSFFKKLLGDAAAESAQVTGVSVSQGKITRRSSGLQEFVRALGKEEGLRVLDLGPTSPTNIARLTEQGHKVYNEDVLLASLDPAFQSPGEDGKPFVDPKKFLEDNLNHQRHQFDAVLCWDVPDYMAETLVKPMVERLHYITKPGGVLLAFFHTRDAGPEAPYFRYHMVGNDALELQKGPRFRLQRVFNNRHIENLFKDFGSLKFFLAKDAVREVLVVR